MKKVLKGNEPPLLLQYRTVNPTNTWKQYCRPAANKQQVDAQLRLDQGGLCAYCEIDLIESDNTGKADFRVEHFHPKTDTSTAHNWHLDWNNLLGCCHGGSQRDVADERNRFTSPDNSCDVPKENKILDNIILNPLLLPASPAIYQCDRSTGEISVIVANCQSAGVSEVQAQNTINELHLIAPRLNRLRKTVLDDLNSRIASRVAQGDDISAARTYFSKIYLNKNENGNWSKFFTSIRSYLGSDAEQHLQNIGFNG